MSFASILSGPADERPPKRLSPQPAATPTPAVPAPLSVSQRGFKESELNSVPLFSRLDQKPGAENRLQSFEHAPGMGGFSAATVANQPRPPVPSRPSIPQKTLTQRDLEHINKIMNDIENTETSDVEEPGFEAEQERYTFKGKKRALNTERAEGHRCKVRCIFIYFIWVLILMKHSGASMTF